MIELDGVKLYTEKQWEKKHRHVLKGQLKKGVEREWRSPRGNESAMFYSEEQTRPWSKKDVEAAKRKRREAAKKKREAEMREEIWLAAQEDQRLSDLFDCWDGPIDTISDANLQDSRIDHTAYQWCVLGFVPIADARWKPVTYNRRRDDSTWYYCSKWDVRYDPARARELLKTGPRECDRLPDGGLYDGHPWWQA